MPDRTYLDWPFLDDTHRRVAQELASWAASHLQPVNEANVDAECVSLVRALGKAGWLRYLVPEACDGRNESLGLRYTCLFRETLAFSSSLADFAFAMQGLGSAPISLYGSDHLRRRYLPRVAAGQAIAAFAMSEAGAGSDIANMKTVASRDGHGYVIEGEKTWISNAGIADYYVVFCRLPDHGDKSFLAAVVDSDNAGLQVTARTQLLAPHPIGTIRLHECRVPSDAVIGELGQGLKVALATLDLFRTTVGAAAVGFARRAFDEAIAFCKSREVFGQPLSEFQLTRARLADMAVAIDCSALLVYRAAWTRDTGQRRITRESAMAKLYATEAAQQVIDQAVQLLGARGLVSGHPLERLYREIRALRIYEGTSEIQKLVIAGKILTSVENHAGGQHA